MHHKYKQKEYSTKIYDFLLIGFIRKVHLTFGWIRIFKFWINGNYMDIEK